MNICRLSLSSLILSCPLVTDAQVIIIDDLDPGYSTIGAWNTQTPLGGRYNDDWQFQTAAAGTETATFAFGDLVASRYVASRASWSQGNLSADAVWTFSDSGGSFRQDQRILVNDFDTDDGVAFQRFVDAVSGTMKVFEIIDGDLEVILSDNDPGGFLIADALRLERLRSDAVEIMVIGNGDPGYSEVGGTWTSFGGDPGDHGPDMRFSDGTLEDEVQVEFSNLTAGNYRVSVAWTGGANRTSEASLTYMTSGDSDTITYDQVPGATADDIFEEVAWQDMFPSVAVSEGSLTLTLKNGAADGLLIADGFRIERIDTSVGFDTDGDGLPNSWEDDFGLNKNDAADAALDGDSDGLTNLEEFAEGTLPNDGDTDGDGLSDGREVNDIGTNPVVADTDADGLTDGEEAGDGGSGTNPLVADTDDDGQGDKFEIDASTDPLIANPWRVLDGAGDEYLVIDNGIATAGAGVDLRVASYSEPGIFSGQDLPVPTSWNGDRRWGDNGEVTAASWLFEGIAAARYEVFASWNNEPQANLGAARYTLGEGGPVFDVEQSGGTLAINDLTLNDGVRDVNFVRIGEVIFGGGDLAITVDDTVTGAGSGFIFADAIAIRSLASTQPVIKSLVLQGGGNEAELTWRSVQGAAYDVEFGTDLSNWTTVVSGINSTGAETMATINVSALDNPDLAFFRVKIAEPQ